MQQINFNNKKVTPSKIICIGRNYVKHIKELNNETPDSMVVFNKTNSALSSELYYINENTRFEGEICFLIQNKKIAGIGFGLDLTDAKVQKKMKEKGLPWERAKSFDKSAVLSDFIEFEGNIEDIRMELFLNTKLIQEATYDLMIYKPNEMLKEIDSFMSLEDNDIIMSGTPKGVGYYKVNDNFTGKIYNKNKLVLTIDWQVKSL
ncbi:MAG TPA: FAA hydrolase family protein [Sulfurimonas sp.]|nr:FAA hydrolase family protein [Sulfurimonas sp.]HIM75511.1 FAA hydrolase family protein [Campylobacterales bacterium]